MRLAWYEGHHGVSNFQFVEKLDKENHANYATMQIMQWR